MRHLPKTHRKGFTLIELLVVIAIVGILTAVGLIQMFGVRERARDTKRKTDLGSIRSALTLYYDSYNSFPSSPSFIGFNQSSDATNVLYAGLVENGRIIPSFPTTPLATEQFYYASCTWDSMPDNDYTLYAILESPRVTGGVWVISRSKGTSQEEAMALCPQT